MIGNGDVVSGSSALAMMEETGCDGVMIGRGAQGNPWIFSDLLEYERTGKLRPRPGADEIREMMLRHARLQIRYKGEYLGIREMRKHVSWYTKGLQVPPGSERPSTRWNPMRNWNSFCSKKSMKAT